MNITPLSHDFYSGFSVEIDSVSIAFGYFNAFKSIGDYGVDEAKTVRTALKSLFITHAVVAGDMNSTPRAIQIELAMHNIKREMFEFPTYLFPADPSSQNLHLPCFDNFIWDNSQVHLTAKPDHDLPIMTDGNPRDMIRTNQYLSDHIAVSAQIQTAGYTLNACIFNVADPTLWYQYYPAAGNGFDLDLESETNRQAALFDVIVKQASINDLVFLEEVPATLAKKLSEKFSIIYIISMQSAVEVENISKLVLIQKTYYP